MSLVKKIELDTINNQDSINLKINSNLNGDTSQSYFALHTRKPIPKRAAMYSALLPGLGQYYNRQYWKIPIVYAGIAFAGYNINIGVSNYNEYRKALVARFDGDPNTLDLYQNYSTTDLINLRTQSRQQIDKLVAYSLAWYGLNIVDALTYAHLKDFDISKNLSLRAFPSSVSPSLGIAYTKTF
jgi:hypothetical protein